MLAVDGFPGVIESADRVNMSDQEINVAGMHRARPPCLLRRHPPKCPTGHLGGQETGRMCRAAVVRSIRVRRPA